MNRLIIALSGILLVGIVVTSPVLAANISNGDKVFEAHCAGCHINGGNIIRRNKTLKLNVLKRNGYNTLDTIATIVANGKANMSAYKDRLSQTDIEDVSAYVLEQANQDWKH